MTEVLGLGQKSFRSDRMSVIEGDTAQLHTLRMAVLDLVCHPELEPSDEQVSNLIVATLAWAGYSSSQWRPEGSCVNGARTRVAKLTQEVIEAHYKQPIRIEDLCRVTGVGIRTLQRSFRAYFDITITEYLAAVRLDAAYRELYATYPQQDTVTAIALRHGITHVGRFSVDFRQRFGESPSKLLATYADRKSHIRESSATTAYAAGPH
jgi:transcriptional regulator GlxA family with amidase domain